MQLTLRLKLNPELTWTSISTHKLVNCLSSRQVGGFFVFCLSQKLRHR